MLYDTYIISLFNCFSPLPLVKTLFYKSLIISSGSNPFNVSLSSLYAAYHCGDSGVPNTDFRQLQPQKSKFKKIVKLQKNYYSNNYFLIGSYIN